MRRRIANIVLMIIFFAIQSCIFPFIPFLAGSPNFMVILVFTYGFIYGEREGIFYGVFAGILMDLFYSNVLWDFLPSSLFGWDLSMESFLGISTRTILYCQCHYVQSMKLSTILLSMSCAFIFEERQISFFMSEPLSFQR